MPFVDSTLSRIGSDLLDGGLRVTARANIGKSILVIGTAVDGPVNIPVRVSDIGGLRRATDVFGPVAEGTLLHTAIEAQNANNQGKDIRLLRISDGNQADLSLKEVVTAGTTANLESYDYSVVPPEQFADVLVLTALYPGQIYNQVSIRSESGDGISRLATRYVVVYNPKTGVESWFSYDYTDFNADVDVHTVEELADAINADTNLNTVLTAAVRRLEADYTIDLSDPQIGGSLSEGVYVDSNGYFRIVLSERTPIYVTGGPAASGISDVTVSGGASNVPTTGNLIEEIIKVFELREHEQRLNIKGRAVGELDFVPLKGSSTAGTQTVITYIDDTAFEYTISQAILHYQNQLIDTIVDPLDFTYTWESPVCPDDGTTHIYTGAISSMVTVNGLSARSVVGADFSPIAIKSTKNNITTTIPSGTYSLAYVPATDTVSLTFAGPSDVLSGYLLAGAILTADYDTVVEDLTDEAASRTSVLGAGDFHLYFVSGKTITFGENLPADISLRYRYENLLEENSDFVVASSSSSSKDDSIRFLHLTTQPSLSGSTNANPITLGLNYTYNPQWVDIATVKTLTGGTNGINITSDRKYELLSEAFATIGDYPVGIVTLAETYIDETKTIYNADTGTPVEVNAGYHTIFAAYLEGLTGATSETIGIMSVKPSTGNTPTAVASWLDKLVTPNPSDPYRAANFLPSFGSKYMTVLAMEPIFSNEAAFVPYAGTGEGLYAGLLASLPVNTSPTNKPVFGLSGLRYYLSGGVNGQIDKLNKARLVSLTLNPNGAPVISAGLTFASPGSDYAREMTRNVVFETMALVRAVCQPYLGEGNSLEVRNAMHTAINSGLQRMVENKALQAFDFEISSTPQDQVLGIVNIEMTLVPVFELREIRVTVKLRSQI